MSETQSTRAARVLIVDDHPFMRRGLAQIIDDQPNATVCGEAACFAEALEQVRATQPDVVVVDISLPDGNGLELTKEIKTQWPEVKILISSMHDESLFAERALRAGASGYVGKSENVEDFIVALQRVLEGRVFLSPRMTDRVLRQVRADKDDQLRSPLEKLSDRELQVFEMIGNGLSTKQIAGRLELSRKTVETHREHIKTKLNLKNASELTQHAVQWVLEQASQQHGE